jgi:Protein of unknown function (DUF2975)
MERSDMRPENETRLRKIRHASTAFRVICDLLLALIALIGVGTVVTVVSGLGGVDLGDVMFRTAGMGVGHRLILGAITSAAWGILFKCIYHLRRLFGDFARGEIFTRHAVGQLRWFGIACVLWGVMSFVWMLSLAVSSHPTRTFAGNLDSLVTGAVIIVIAWFMDMATDLREENELTI